jgi:hypothetical protein
VTAFHLTQPKAMGAGSDGFGATPATRDAAVTGKVACRRRGRAAASRTCGMSGRARCPAGVHRSEQQPQGAFDQLQLFDRAVVAGSAHHPHGPPDQLDFPRYRHSTEVRNGGGGRRPGVETGTAGEGVDESLLALQDILGAD